MHVNISRIAIVFKTANKVALGYGIDPIFSVVSAYDRISTREEFLVGNADVKDFRGVGGFTAG